MGYVFGNGATSGVLTQELASLGNADLKWEKTTGLNFGVDFNMFSSKIQGTFEAYKTTTKSDLLFDVAVPSVTGFTGIRSNVGKIENRGIEFSLTYLQYLKQHFRVDYHFQYLSQQQRDQVADRN